MRFHVNWKMKQVKFSLIPIILLLGLNGGVFVQIIPLDPADHSSTNLISQPKLTLVGNNQARLTYSSVPVLDLPMDENTGNLVYDQSGYGNHGTIHGANWTTGITGNALEVGAADYVSVPNHVSLNPTSQITIMAWIKANLWGKKPSVGRLHNYLLDKEDQYTFEADLIDNKLIFHLNTGGYLRRLVNAPLSTPLPSIGDWHHVTGTYNEFDRTICLYIDGQIADNTLASIYGGDQNYQLYTCNKDLIVGTKHGLQVSYYFNGIIDELKIYDRALSPEEISEEFDNFYPPPDHDLLMSLERARRVRGVRPNETIIINSTVKNRGLKNESSAEQQLWIDETLVADQTYSSLLIGATETLTYQWVPYRVGIYNITAYTPPVRGENYTQNNRFTEMVTVSDFPAFPPTITSNAPYGLYADQSFSVTWAISNVVPPVFYVVRMKKSIIDDVIESGTWNGTGNTFNLAVEFPPPGGTGGYGFDISLYIKDSTGAELTDEHPIWVADSPYYPTEGYTILMLIPVLLLIAVITRKRKNY